MRKNEDKLIHKIGRGVVTGVMTTSLALTGTPALLMATQTVAVAEGETAEYTVGKDQTAGETTFGSINDAIKAAKAAEAKNVTITLTSDMIENVSIPSGLNVTIDTAKYTITNTPTSTKEATIVVNKGATLTLKGGGTIDGNGGDYSSHKPAAIINRGTAYINDVTLTRSGENSDDSYYVICNSGQSMEINNGATVKFGDKGQSKSGLIENGYQTASYNNGSGAPNPTLVINGGTFNGGKHTIHNDLDGTLTIKGGTFTNTTKDVLKNNGTATIEGGKFKGSGTAILNGQDSSEPSHSVGSLTIKGGEFNVDGEGSSVLGTSDDFKEGAGTVTISGGTFNNTLSKPESVKSLSISGGTFVNDVSDYADSVIQVGNKYYVGDDATNAVKNAAAPDSVTVLKATDGLALPPTQATVTNNTNAKVTVGNTPIKNGESTKDVTDDKAELQTLANNNQAILDQMDQRKFSDKSVQALKDAVAKANQVAKSDSTGTDDVTAAKNDLNDAYKALKNAPGVSMFRLYNPNSGEHFYTASKAEHDYLVKVGWHDEGTGWTAPASSNSPVYRLYNPNAGDHHYTLDAGERDYLISAGWTYEGIGWFSDDAKEVPLYRQYNPNAKAGAHNFTTAKEENDFLVSKGWKAEGIGWYGIKPAEK